MCSATPSPTICSIVIRGRQRRRTGPGTRPASAGASRAASARSASSRRIALERDAARGDRLQREQRHAERGLARPRFADDAERLAALQLERRRRAPRGTRPCRTSPCGDDEVDADVAARRRGPGASAGTGRTARCGPAVDELDRVRMPRPREHVRRSGPARPAGRVSITPTRCVKRRTRLRSWVMNRIAIPYSRCRSSSSARICAWIVTSSAVVGSSAISSFGPAGERHRDHRALPLAARELVRERVDAAFAGRECRCARAARSRGRARASCAQPLVQLEHLGDLVADRVQRIQRRHRLLEDHRDVAAAQRAHLPLALREHVLALEADRALRSAPSRGAAGSTAR